MSRHFQIPSRCEFLKWAGLGTAGSVLPNTRLLQPVSLAAAPNAQRQRPLQLALASYTTRKFDLDQTLKMTQRVGLPAICLKSFHLPLECRPK